jgi:hydroxymethylpyrimidine pyrophosphatase-like HAD family hydrolase
MGVHPSNVMALGDGENDVEMLQAVGVSQRSDREGKLFKAQ